MPRKKIHAIVSGKIQNMNISNSQLLISLILKN